VINLLYLTTKHVFTIILGWKLPGFPPSGCGPAHGRSDVDGAREVYVSPIPWRTTSLIDTCYCEHPLRPIVFREAHLCAPHTNWLRVVYALPAQVKGRTSLLARHNAGIVRVVAFVTVQSLASPQRLNANCASCCAITVLRVCAEDKFKRRWWDCGYVYCSFVHIVFILIENENLSKAAKCFYQEDVTTPDQGNIEFRAGT